MSNSNTITLTKLSLESCNCVAINFIFSEQTKAIVQSINGIKWTSKRSKYYIPYTSNSIHYLFKYFKSKGYYVDYRAFAIQSTTIYKEPTKIKNALSMVDMFSALPKNYKTLLKGFAGHLRGKRLSESTVKSYGYFVLRFLHFYNPKAINEIDRKAIDLFFE